jgi:hypothetical protein
MKTLLALLLGCGALVAGARAEACINDTDCGATCGGMVCSFAAATYQKCVAASTGDPGWCTSNAGCQCPGATCNATTHYCSTTMPAGSDGGTTAMDMAKAAAAPDLAMPQTTTTSSSSCSIGGAVGAAPFPLLLPLLLLRRRRR